MAQVTLAINVFFILLGIWGLAQFVSTSDLGFGFLTLVGCGTLIFGIIIPGIILANISRQIGDLKQNLQNQGTQFVAHWLEDHSRRSTTFMSPRFWTDILLFGAQWTAQNSQNPVATVVREMAPAIREELRRHKEAKPSRKLSKKVSRKASKKGIKKAS